MADIPINAVHRRVQFTSVGSVGPYSFSFAILAEGDIAVYDASALKTLTTHYTVSITAGAGTGTITFTSGNAPTSGNIITIISDQAVARTSDFTTSGDYRAATINDELDRITIIQQQLESVLRRAPQLDVFSNRDVSDSGAGPLTFPYGSTVAAVAAQADGFIKFDALGTSLETSSTGAAQSLGGNGTVLLPYYSFSADPNSGMYRIGADNIGWSVNGVKGLDLSTTGLTVTGTLDVGGDTSAGDNAAMGYTSAEGLILTGQGSTNDVTVKNDADAIALEVPTGTQNVNMLGNLVLTGNLTVNGTTVTNDATNTEIKDPLIELNSGAGSNANDLGFIFERGSTGNNGFLGWDESGDYFVAATTTATGSSTGNISYSYAPFKCSAITATSGTLAGLTSIAMSAGATLTAGFLDEDDMASDSAVAGVTQQAAKAYIDNNAPENGVKFAWESTTTDTDQGAGKVWGNNGTHSSITVLYVDDVEAGSVSVNAWVDTWDDVSNAVARGMIYIASYGTTNAILVYKVTGSVVSASTYSKIAVTHVLTVGTISDGDSIGLTFVPSGADGAGDLASANNLSDVASAATSFGNIKQAATASATGVVELATDAETNTGSSTTLAITPANLTAWTGDTAVVTVGTIGTGTWQGTAVASSYMASATDGAKGAAELATTAETTTGTDSSRVVTPAGLHGALAGLTDTTITASDALIFSDATDGGALKEDTVQGILDLAGGGAWVLLGSVTASGAATVSFTSSIDSTYHAYTVIATGIIPGTDDQDLWCRLGSGSIDSGSTDYSWVVFGGQSDDAGGVDVTDDADHQDAQIILAGDNSTSTAFGTGTGETGAFVLTLMDPSASTYTQVQGQMSHRNRNNVFRQNTFAGWRVEAAAHDQIQFLMASGTITGEFRLYGIANA
jgi:hypothetical protein